VDLNDEGKEFVDLLFNCKKQLMEYDLKLLFGSWKKDILDGLETIYNKYIYYKRSVPKDINDQSFLRFKKNLAWCNSL